MATEEKSPPTAYGRVQLDSVEINADRPLPRYNNGPIKAYEAIMKGEFNTPCFALICEKSLSPRIETMKTYAQMPHETSAQLLKWGPVLWPAAGQERYALVYKSNIGNSVVRSEEERGGLGWKNEMVIEVAVKPMVSLLTAYRDRDFIHGAIRVDNMFDGGGARLEKVVLGDCLSTPVSYTQPVVYETIYRGMADPIARGRGAQSDDLYSFGVALAILMRTRDPLKGMSDHDIIRQKIDVGTYAAITGKDRFTGSMLELLRGLLNDDPNERWKLDEVQAWLDGRRLSPKQPWKQKKAARPLSMGGHKYMNGPMLAMDLDKYQGESISLIQNGELEQWIMRSLEDTVMLERYQQTMMPFQGAPQTPGFHDRLLCNASFAIDPPAPLRYRGAHILGDGVGAAITEKMVNRQDTKAYNDMLSHGMILNWAMSQDSNHMDTGGLLSKFDSCRSFLRHNKLGFGFERCIYFLDPDAPCLSDKLRDYAVHTPEEMLMAFEDLAKKGKASPMFLDRQSVAFLAIKERRCIDNQLFDLNAREEHRRLLAELKTFALLQQVAGVKSLPAMAQAFGKRMHVLIARFHDRRAREKLTQSINDYITAGDLTQIVKLIGNPDVIAKDFQAFREGMYEFSVLLAEASGLQKGLKNKKTYGSKNSGDVSAVVCAIIAVLIVMGIGFINYMR